VQLGNEGVEEAARVGYLGAFRASDFEFFSPIGSYPAPYSRAAMNIANQTSALSETIIDSHRLITGLRHALDVNYARVLAAAQERWERNFGADPSDACVSVRISSGKPLAGILKKSSRSLLHPAGRQLLA
jgi:hypothetical protein